MKRVKSEKWIHPQSNEEIFEILIKLPKHKLFRNIDKQETVKSMEGMIKCLATG